MTNDEASVTIFLSGVVVVLLAIFTGDRFVTIMLWLIIICLFGLAVSLLTTAILMKRLRSVMKKLENEHPQGLPR